MAVKAPTVINFDELLDLKVISAIKGVSNADFTF